MTSRLGLKSSAKKATVYHGEICLGELEAVPVEGQDFRFPNDEIRIQRVSAQSERCPPISVLQTISSFSVVCKLQSPDDAKPPLTHLINLHATCFHEGRTAISVLPAGEEIHLVAMPSKNKNFPCFWCFSAPPSLYHSCLGLLNLRCLAIVFDLDETLFVALTMKSFEDQIESLRGRIFREADMVRVTALTAELKRYADDRALLKQYADTDCVALDNGKVIKAQLEEVPRPSDSLEKLVRPVIRLEDKNLVLTRINPEIRDTSVLVRLRPAWEDLRSYLTARGRKRFEVYVCTMAERDYALEMWRLLDPEAQLITTGQLPNRVVCVKSGFRKSLLNVFRDGICHPKMAMVIDDRSKVWEDRDQPRVHVVPPFSPYSAPQAETANAVPVLCVARNVACNVRGCFFKEFDENLLRKISEVFYEDEAVNLPSPPDVSSYLMTEDPAFVSNGTSALIPEGMQGVEADERVGKNFVDMGNNFTKYALHLRPEGSYPTMPTVSSTSGPNLPRSLMQSQRPGLLGNSTRQDSIYPDKESDLKRKNLISKSVMDLRNQGLPESPLLPKPPAQRNVAFQTQGNLLMDDLHKARVENGSSETLKFDGHLPNNTRADNLQKLSSSSGHQTSDIGPDNQKHSHESEYQPVIGKVLQSNLQSQMSIGVLHEIGRRCSSKVEFRSIINTSKDLQFSVEVLFTGEKIGVGMGKTKKDAQQQAAMNALHSLSEKYVAFATSNSHPVDENFKQLSNGKDNGFLWEDVGLGAGPLTGTSALSNEGNALGYLHRQSGDPPRFTNSPSVDPFFRLYLLISRGAHLVRAVGAAAFLVRGSRTFDVEYLS
ncbi:hypothetical protein MLD38_020282 [Melastoma candidum]|uniref:Uncharacterized protein n=1 Tax=Melastoma candidum TaxID=119954 RepID=A0ACB9QEA7_9MYRT|nr:hypothetical protein MLD38_020282 [Melastoma candidum]